MNIAEMTVKEFCEQLHSRFYGKEGYMSIEAERTDLGNMQYNICLDLKAGGRELRTRKTDRVLLEVLQETFEDLFRL